MRVGRRPKMLGTLELCPLEWAWLTARNTPLPTPYVAEFCRCMNTTHMRPKMFGDAGVVPLKIVEADLYKHAPTHECYHSELNCTSVITVIRQSNLTIHIPLFKFTQGHWN